MKKEIRRIRLNGLTKPGNINAQTEFSKCRSRISKYSGMIPPLKNIVMMMTYMKSLRPFSFFLVNGYAAAIVNSMHNTVVTIVKSAV
ncbi:hypothetical protein D3C76_1342990 [compost metagenome]